MISDASKTTTTFSLQACQSYQYPLIHHSGGMHSGTKRYFKNMDCADCILANWHNGTGCLHKNDTAELGPKYNVSSRIMFDHLALIKDLDKTDKNESLRQFQENMIKNTVKYTPISISVLINFGFYDQHFLYNTENIQHHCLRYQIWDPFTRICRTVFCSADFNLAEVSCLDTGGWINGSGLYESEPVPISSDVLLQFTVYVKVKF